MVTRQSTEVPAYLAVDGSDLRKHSRSALCIGGRVHGRIIPFVGEQLHIPRPLTASEVSVVEPVNLPELPTDTYLRFVLTCGANTYPVTYALALHPHLYDGGAFLRTEVLSLAMSTLLGLDLNQIALIRREA